MPFGWVLLVGLSFGLAALGLGLLGADESLWVDELHTSWVISDNPYQLAARAAAGNQSLGYFILVLSFEQFASTVGTFLPSGLLTSEWKLRLPSMIAWSLTIGIACAYLIQTCLAHTASLELVRLPSPERGVRSPVLGAPSPVLGVRGVGLRKWCVGLAGQLRWRAYSRQKEVQSAKQAFFPGDSKTLNELDRTHSTNGKVVDSWCGSLGQSAPVVGWCLCLLLDRMQWFYSVEARVYSIVQLLSLVGWLVVARALSPGASEAAVLDATYSTPRHSRRAFHRHCMAWTAIAIGLLNLHVTTLPTVCAQLLALGIHAIRRPQLRFCLVCCALILLGTCWLMMGDLQPVWDRRSQWRSIGGNASLHSLLHVLPLLPILIPVAMAWCLSGILSVLKSKRRAAEYGSTHLPNQPETASARVIEHPVQISANRFGCSRRSWQPGSLWALAVAAPLLNAWLLARLDIAPMFHYRFVITAAIPLYLFAGWLTMHLPSTWLRCLAVLGTLSWSVVSQGTLADWQQGKLIGQARGEGWREAVQYISQRIDAQQDTLWCHAGLIEGGTAKPPLSVADREYLSYPLRGCYQVAVDGKRLQPMALVGQSRYWGIQIMAGGNADVKSLAHHAKQNTRDRTRGVWIVSRGSGQALEKRLELAKLEQHPQRFPIVEFGRVSVVCLQFEL